MRTPGSGRRVLFAVAVAASSFIAVMASFQSPKAGNQEKARAAVQSDRSGPKDPGSPSSGVIVAAVQYFSTMGAIEENRRTLLLRVEEAAALGARLVVLPETAVQGYMSADGSMVWKSPGFVGDEKEASLENVAETVPGPSTVEFGKIAARLRIYIVVPLVEVDPGSGLYYNTAVLMSPDGKIRLHYRKAHPWVPAEYAWASPGPAEPAVVDTEIGRIGLMICYDVHSMPGGLSEAGADIVCTPAWWVDHDPEFWFGSRLPGIAKANKVAIVAANRAATGAEGELPGAGISIVIDASGGILAMSGTDGEDMVLARLPPRNGVSR